MDLHPAQFVLGDDQVSLERLGCQSELAYFSSTDIGCAIGGGTFLEHLSDGKRAGSPGE